MTSIKTIAVIGSHSALEICDGAKRCGFRTLVVAAQGREKPYYAYRTRKRQKEDIGIVDEVIVLPSFSDILEKEEKLIQKQSIIIPHRSMVVYIGHDKIASMKTPIFGNRSLLKAEERDVEKNQYYLLAKAGIRIPHHFSDPEKIDRLVIVKVAEAKRSYERAFFFAASPEEYMQRSQELIQRGITDEKKLQRALIEEYVVGAQFNFNFFYSPLHEELELIGIDTRRQTNLDGFLHIPAHEQEEVRRLIPIRTIEVGHIACTIRESLLEQVFEMGEQLVETCKREYPPGIIGPFALQTIIPSDEEPVVFDVSFRMPGSPGIAYTPYSRYLYKREMSMGERVCREIADANKKRCVEMLSAP